MRRQELISRLEPILRPATSVGSTRKESTPAAVLVILHYHEGAPEPRVVLTRRSARVKTHKSEISFPGGRLSAEDGGDLARTALRETKEEIGLSFDLSDVHGALAPVSTMTSNHFIVPFVTVQDRIAERTMSPDEVDEIIDAPLMQTLQSIEADSAHYELARDACQFTYHGNVIWGATARIMKQMYSVLIRPS